MIHYFARCQGIVRMGPFTTELMAWEAIRWLDGLPVPEATVWPEVKRPVSITLCDKAGRSRK